MKHWMKGPLKSRYVTVCAFFQDGIFNITKKLSFLRPLLNSSRLMRWSLFESKTWRFQRQVKAGDMNTTPKMNMVSSKIDMFNIGNRSSKGVCSIAILVFGGGMHPENTVASDRIFYYKSSLLKRMVQWFHSTLCFVLPSKCQVSPSEAIPKKSHHWPRAPAWAQARKTDPQLSFKNLSIFSFSAEGSRKIRWQRINSRVKHVGSPERSESDNHESIHGLKPIHIQLIFAASIIP